MDQKIILVDNKTFLLDLALVGNLRYRVKKYQISLNLGLNPEQKIAWEKRLNLFYSDCGCDTGALFTLLGVGLYVACLWFFKSLAIVPPGLKAYLGFTIVVISAVAGKIMGLHLSGKRFKAEVTKLLSLIDHNSLGT